MKTIKELAEELGVSKEAIRQQVTKLPSRCYKIGVNRTKYINADGEAIIRQSVTSKVPSQVPSSVPSETPENSDIVAVLQATLDELHSQLAAKDKQIEHLTEMLADNQRLLAQQQQLTALAEHKALQLEAKEAQEDTADSPRRWWMFWK